jgi:hypothetical protein
MHYDCCWTPLISFVVSMKDNSAGQMPDGAGSNGHNRYPAQTRG